MNKAAAESITPRVGSKRRWQRAPGPLRRGQWPWVWLAIGTALLPFANLQTLIPLTAWLAPVFLLRFTRDQRLLVGYPVLVLAMSGALFVALRNGFFPVLDGPGCYLFVATLAIGGALPFAVDRVLAPRLAGIPRTLVFPAAVTTVEFLGTIGNPFGAAGSTAYSQYAGLPLLQLVSVTGIWGLTFLVSWFAPVVNEAWERAVKRRGDFCDWPVRGRHCFGAALRRGPAGLRRAGRGNSPRCRAGTRPAPVRARLLRA